VSLATAPSYLVLAAKTDLVLSRRLAISSKASTINRKILSHFMYQIQIVNKIPTSTLQENRFPRSELLHSFCRLSY
jgi:hypothetical protein